VLVRRAFARRLDDHVEEAVVERPPRRSLHLDEPLAQAAFMTSARWWQYGLFPGLPKNTCEVHVQPARHSSA
jgi:hypothetical protein